MKLVKNLDDQSLSCDVLNGIPDIIDDAHTIMIHKDIAAFWIDSINDYSLAFFPHRLVETMSSQLIRKLIKNKILLSVLPK